MVLLSILSISVLNVSNILFISYWGEGRKHGRLAGISCPCLSQCCSLIQLLFLYILISLLKQFLGFECVLQFNFVFILTHFYLRI